MSPLTFLVNCILVGIHHSKASSGRRLLQREERQASILHGAAVAFARSGFAATSMDDVAEACQVTKLIVYRHFESKEELYRAILQRVFDRQAQELVRGLTGAAPGLGMRTLLTVAREDPAAFVLLWRHAAREPQFAEYAAEQRSMSVLAVKELMQLNSSDPVLDRWSAEVVIGWLVEAVLTWLEVGDAGRDEELIVRASEGLRRMRSGWISEALPITP
jgi:AcrR family transcriptional regulator